jgi:hypothetical protein
MRREYKVGEDVELLAPQLPNAPTVGTVTRVTKNKVLVLFPIHKYVWLDRLAVSGVIPTKEG